MLKVTNTEVFGWEAAIRGMRNLLESWEKSDSGWHGEFIYATGMPIWDIGPNDLTLMKKLVATGSDHSKFMRMIHVQCDWEAPLLPSSYQQKATMDFNYATLRYMYHSRNHRNVYSDCNRWVFEAPDHPNIPWHNGFLSKYLDEKFPIQFPYNPVTIHVRVEEILTDPAHGDYDAQHIIDFADPETGRKVGVDAYFEEVDGKWQEIGKRKWYTLRKKHGERLAAILKAKEE